VGPHVIYLLFLELLDHVKQVLPEPEEEDAKAKYKKNEIKAKRILTNSIKDHLIPNVSELKTLLSPTFRDN
jgi:hypothetical protein